MQLTTEKVVFIVFFFVFMLALVYSVSASEISPPTLIGESNESSLSGKIGNGNEETPGEWYAGLVPSNPIPNAPVILFVPGLNNVAQIFWEDNDMYQTALDAGYQTAFVQLYDAGGASATMWDNGELLAEKIREISTHFDRPVTIVAYSKGGVDSQTALTYYGAWQYVDNVITLSSPHHGSQLADLAYSSPVEWLADLLGAQGDGTYALQMGYMENFRSEMDNQPLAYHNNYYTLGGTGWGFIFSSTWFGGMYLSQFGSNDGVVTSGSSSLPGGHQLAVEDWNHISIRTGESFASFENYLMENDTINNLATSTKSTELPTPSVNQWITGGQLVNKGRFTTTVSVENDVRELSLHLMTSNKLSEINLIDPDGKEINLDVTTTENAEGIFAGSISHVSFIEKPKAGDWKLELITNQEDAFVLMADYKTTPKIIRNSKLEFNENQKNTYNLKAIPETVQENTLQATYHVTESGTDHTKTYRTTGKADLSENLTFVNKGKVYNITIEINGLTKEGEPFTRTIVDSVYVD
ncbi:esterase/lipase family protein [Oceanobacillus sp. 1P07AA]|uniref:esterase/lipase family protein n=1 Tax=Oceanobacillus sp. 1P07AA TaxID=3132293 RepID=UPI0039A61AE9